MPQLGVAIGKERTALLDDFGSYCEIEDLTDAGYTFVEHEVELGFLERRSHFVLHHFDAHLVTLDDLAVFDLARTTDIEAHRSIELKGVAAGSCLGVTEHNADFFAELVDENDRCAGFVHRSCHLTQRLRHQTSLKTDFVVAHLAGDLCFRCEGRYRVDDDEVHRRRTDQFVSDLQRLLSAIRLRDQQFVYVHTEFLGIETIERVLGIDDSGYAAVLLHLRHGVGSQRGLTGRLRTIDLDDASARITAYAKRVVETQTARRDNGYVLDILVA